MDGDSSPAMLKLLERDVYTLGDLYKLEREFLEAGTNRSRASSVKGKKRSRRLDAGDRGAD